MTLRGREILGLAGILLLLGLYGLDATGGLSGLFSSSGATVTATFANAQQLAAGDPVRVHGVQVGTVTGISLLPGGRAARVTMGVQSSALPLHADATARILISHPAGGNFSIALDPGHPGSPTRQPPAIPESHTTSQVELDDLTHVIHGGAESGIRTTLAQLPHAFATADALGDTLRALAKASPGIRGGLAALRGDYPGELTQMLKNTDATVQALDAPGETALTQLVEGGAVTLGVTAARRADIRSAITQAANTLPPATQTLHELTATLSIADPLLAQLRPTAPAVAPTLSALRPTLVGLTTLLHNATPLLNSLHASLPALASAARTGIPVLNGIRPTLKRIDLKILPDLARVEPESKHPTYEMIGPTIAGLDAPFSAFDGATNYVRFLASGSGRALDTLPCRLMYPSPTAPDFLTCESLQAFINRVLGGSS